MTLEEFRAKAAKDDGWAPGWDAIEEVFEKLYPGQKPSHYGTDMTARAIFGGDQYLDGYSVYTSPKGYKHIVTFGMTHLYVEDEECFGDEWNNWGYEMTLKLAEEQVEECVWGINLLANLARYTYTSQRFFEPYQYISNGGNPIKAGSDTAITALLVVPDTEAEGVDTIYGRTDFLQLVGITEPELKMIEGDFSKAEALAEKLRGLSGDLVTDLNRRESVMF